MMAKTVSGAMEALRRQCFQITFHSGIPFTRASFTNSLSSTSSMDERTSRMMMATWNQPSVMAGSMRCWSPPRPEAGSQPSITAKTHISTIPSQKPGSDWPRSAMIFAAVSMLLPFATAASTPIGRARIALKRSANPASSSVAGRRSATRAMAD